MGNFANNIRRKKFSKEAQCTLVEKDYVFYYIFCQA